MRSGCIQRSGGGPCMKRIRALTLVALAAFSSSCASPPDPTMCAQLGIVLGLGGGVAGGAAIRDTNCDENERRASSRRACIKRIEGERTQFRVPLPGQADSRTLAAHGPG